MRPVTRHSEDRSFGSRMLRYSRTPAYFVYASGDAPRDGASSFGRRDTCRRRPLYRTALRAGPSDPGKVVRALMMPWIPYTILPPKLNDRFDAFSRSEQDRKSTRLNSSHVKISYAVFCLK